MSFPAATMPKLLPVTASFAPVFAAYFVLLNLRVSLSRVETDTMVGTDTSKAKANSDSKPKSNHSPAAAQNLIVNARCHANFVENVPLALLIAAIVEMNGGDKQVLTGALGALFCFRIAHVEFGLRQEASMGWGRSIGYFGTLGFVLGMSSYAALLVKGYWGF